MLWSVQNGYFDDVPVDEVSDFQEKLQTYFTDRKGDLLLKIASEKKVTDEIAAELKAAVEEFKQAGA